MPLEWKVDDARRRVTVTARGSVAPRDLFDYLAAMQETGALRYGRLFDLTGFTGSMAEQTIRALGEAVARHSTLDRAPGPLAIVTDDANFQAQAEIYSRSATADRPVRIFSTAAEAERWLDEQERTG